MTVQVICDFDGTIAERDMISAIMREFVPDDSAPLIREVMAGRMSVQDGVERMFQLIPSKWYDDVVTFARLNTVIRAGFESFIHTCGQLTWKVAVVSGGFDFFVHPIIHSLSTPVDIFCNQVDLTGDFMRVVWGYSCDQHCDGGCGLCKPSVMRKIAGENVDGDTQFIVIGDGVTDYKAAEFADFVFARSSLLKLVASTSIPHASFETFYDVEREIEDRRSSLYGVI